MCDVICPKCDHKFEAETWNSGNCPNCQNEYIWDEQCTEDYSDCWTIILWESNNYKY